MRREKGAMSEEIHTICEFWLGGWGGLWLAWLGVSMTVDKSGLGLVLE